MFMIFILVLIFAGEGGLSVNMNFLLVTNFIAAVAYWKWGNVL